MLYSMLKFFSCWTVDLWICGYVWSGRFHSSSINVGRTNGCDNNILRQNPSLFNSGSSAILLNAGALQPSGHPPLNLWVSSNSYLPSKGSSKLTISLWFSSIWKVKWILTWWLTIHASDSHFDVTMHRLEVQLVKNK